MIETLDGEMHECPDPMNAVREYLVRKITLTADNTQNLYFECRDAAVSALRDHGVNTKSEFGMANTGRGGYRRHELCEEIGSAVSNVLTGWVDTIGDDTVRMLMTDVLDLSDRAQCQLLGEHYWPNDDEDFDDDEDPEDVPDDFPVAVLWSGDPAPGRVTCGECGRSWDDSVVTSMTPAPSGRCPFEQFHN